MVPVLYKLDGSPPANAVRMLADIIGLQMELKNVDFLTMEHKSSKYLNLNPMGTIPTLQDGDFVVSDSHAIMKYLLSKYGGDKSESLYPSDVRTRALVDEAMFFNAGVFFIRLKVVALPSVFNKLEGPTDKHKEDIETAYGVLEAFLGKRKYIAADHLTIADLACGATTSSMQPIHKLDEKKYPLTNDWLKRLEQESFFKKIMIPGAKTLEQFLQGCWQRNRH